MTITRNFKLCLNAGTQNAPYINVNQYDEGEQWIFDLYTEGGQKFTPSTGAIIGIKSDGNAILNSGTVNASGQVVITETQQMTAASGLAVFELLIEGETHGTANFIVNVERRPSDDAEFSDSDLSMLQEAIDAAEVINEILDEGGDPSEIIAENVDAWLDNHPEATTTVQDGAITAPKINNSLWDKILVNEEVTGNPASFEDGADDVPVSSLKVALEPIQTGTGDPSPSNIRPIVAANGKNLFTVTQTTQTLDGVTVTINADGTINLTGTSTAVIALVLGYFTPTANTGYYISGSPFATNSCRLQFQEGSTTVANQYNNESVLVENLNETQHRIRLYIANGTNVDGVVIKPMIRLASITDASFQPHQSIMVEQTGANIAHLIDETRTAQGITTTVADEKITATGTASTTYANLNYLHPITITNGQTYTVMLSKPVAHNIVFRFATDSTDATYQNVVVSAGSTKATFTADNNFTLYRLWISGLSNGTTVSITDLQILVGIGDVSTYEPYQSNSYPYSLGQNVYGGTVDLATGVLTVTHEYHALSEFTNWTYSTNSKFFYRAMTGKKEGLLNIISDEYKTGVKSTWTETDDCEISGNNTTSQVYVLDRRYTTAADFVANVTASICYELAEPQTINLTPTQVKTLLGYNNISSTGTVDVIYHADTKLYIDKRIAELG